MALILVHVEMSSWDSYIDNIQLQSKGADDVIHCDRAAIIGLDGALWTTSDHASCMKMLNGETLTIVNGMKQGEKINFQSAGIYAEGVKYQFLRDEDGMVLGKKKDNGAITLGIAKSCIVIGHTTEGGSQGNVNKAVATVTSYLESVGM